MTNDTNVTKTKVQVIDMLVAGGGPGGTAAAFRARELGMTTLIVEYDDLMKRIRDYSKSKLILPGFGGGDKMKFPKGGDMISSLRFEPIDKDALCLRWKGLHKEYKVMSRLSVELTGLRRRKDGIYRVICWNNQERKEQVYLAKNLVLALGNGVPRRFDIPGNTEGIAFRLNDPADYVGRPTCIIGGGTSAAEAVIAISHAKIEARDPSAVYWSYRGDRLPRVSKALADEFFEAYVGNGNIRYFPNSEPSAIVMGSDQQEYLSVRVDRRTMEGRPIETSHLEFPKRDCIACIGEDLPEELLRTMGIVLAHGGPRNKKRVVVNQFLESRQPGVFMIGDLLSQAYLRTEDFDGDPSTFEEVRHRGNIKTALRDGVLVAEVIKQRLDGKTDIQVDIGDLDDLTPSEKPSNQTLTQMLPLPSSAEVSLHRILPNDVVESEHALDNNGVTVIGKSGADISFPDDPLLMDRHAMLTSKDGKFLLEAGTEGADIFMVVPPAQKMTLEVGDLLRVGKQFLLINGSGGSYSVDHYNQRGVKVGTHGLSSKSLILGRDAPDVTLDKDDRSLSRRHLTLSVLNDKVLVKDLKSANHSYLRLRNPTRLKHGDRFQVGSELFVLVGSGESVTRATAATSVMAVQPGAVAEKAKPATPTSSAATTSGEPCITFEGIGTFPVTQGQTICDVAEANGVKLKAECHMGICGSDPVKVIAGMEHLVSGPTEGESETLEDICNLEPGPCRLACVARVNGPVTVQILEV